MDRAGELTLLRALSRGGTQGRLHGQLLLPGRDRLGGSRLFVEESIFDDFVGRLAEMAKAVKLGRPVVCAIRFTDLPDAIAKGNDTPYGLAAGVWTKDLKKAHQAAALLDAGTVWVNCYNAFDNASPWGGSKQSGWGREKGQYGLELFTQVKSVIVNYG